MSRISWFPGHVKKATRLIKQKLKLYGWKAAHIHTTKGTFHGHDHDDPNAADVTVTYVLKDGEEHEVVGKVGQNLLRLGQKYDIPLEGACEGVCACSTCHVILEKKWFNKLDPANEEEKEMLGLLPDLKKHSRLGCQIKLTKNLDGIKIILPKNE